MEISKDMVSPGVQSGMTGMRKSPKNNQGEAMRTGSAGMEVSTQGTAPSTSLHTQTSALSRLLAPDYVRLAFDLPHACSGIWHLIEEDMICLATQKKHMPDTVESLLAFLRVFFSPSLVEIVSHNLVLLAHSFMGLDYTLRVGRGALALRILNDVVREHVMKDDGPLAGFHGDGSAEVSEMEGVQGGGWKDVRKESKKEKGSSSMRSQAPEESAGRAGQGSSRGGGRGGRGGRGSPVIEYVEEEEEQHFEGVEVVEVLLPAYKTPPKGPWQSDEQRARVLSIKDRSLLFEIHSSVTEGLPYDPTRDTSGRIHMFHGTRASSMMSFRSKGIKPSNERGNEFSIDKAFYLTNSLRHAFERPLHAHPSNNLVNPVAVLVFDVDAKVLHGEITAEGMDSPFNVLWFEHADDEWADFCVRNMDKMSKGHKYDIVIGPICIPRPKPMKYGVKKVELNGGAQLTQIAFCTARSMMWVESCVSRVYQEIRSQTPQGLLFLALLAQ